MVSLIILHGWGRYTGSWKKIVDALKNRGLAVFYPGLPGLDESQLLQKQWALDDYVDWAENFIKQNQVETFFILGHSFGGRIAIKLAAKNPKGLRGLILVSAAGIRRKKTAVFFGLTNKIAKIVKKFSFLPGYQLGRKIFYHFILRRSDYLRLDNQIMRDTFKNIIEEDLTHLLLKINVPTLIVWGEKDKDVPLNNAKIMKQKIKNSKLEILKNLKHCPHKENPQLLAQKIINFINNQ